MPLRRWSSTVLLNLHRLRDGITRTIHGNQDPDPPCLGASVRDRLIELDGSANRASRGR